MSRIGSCPRGFKAFQRTPALSFVQIYEAARSYPQSGVKDWKDVWRIYYYPEFGTASVMVRQGWNHLETQIDYNTGKVLAVDIRGKDLLEDIHELKFLGAHYWLTIPMSLIFMLSLISGVVMFFIQPVKTQVKRIFKAA